MDDHRFADLLDEALRTGLVPDSATAEERAELARALPSARAVRELRARVDAEARASMPTARARFERFLDANARPAPAPIAPPASAPRRGFWHGLVTARRSLVGVAAVVVVVAAVALFGGLLTGGEDTASALTPGDYVQLEGVVSAANAGGATVASPVGDVGVDLLADTSILDGETPAEASSIQTGTRVVVSGVVGADGRVNARTLAISKISTTPVAAPTRITVQQLKKLSPNLTGRVVTFTLSADGTKARALIETASGVRYLVPIDAMSAERLLRLTTTLGARVEVGAAGGGAKGIFSLSLNGEGRDGGAAAGSATPASSGTPAAGTPATTGTSTPSASTTAEPSTTEPATGAARPQLVTVTGAILGRVGLNLEVETRRGVTTTVRVDRSTRVVLGANSGLVRGDFERGEPIKGHAISVTGGIDKATGAVVADVILIGPKLPGR